MGNSLITWTKRVMESWRKWLSEIKLRVLGEEELETASLSNSKSVVKGRKKNGDGWEGRGDQKQFFFLL